MAEAQPVLLPLPPGEGWGGAASMADAAYGSLPFAEQIAFFRRKLNLPTESWTDIYKSEHDWAFVVAGANRDALLADLRAAVERAIEDGVSLEKFRKDFDAIVQKHGWDYRGGRNWRSRVIYETNVNTSYAAGRFEQLQAAPYWQYVHADWVTHPRHQHLAWNGLVLARDDPFWQTHFPPNGWGCQCSVRGLWSRDLKRLGKDGPDAAPEVQWLDREIGQNSASGPRLVRVPEGIDPGFEYVPGKARLQSEVPPERPDMPGSMGAAGLPNRRPGDALPPPRPFPADQLLPTGLAPQDYAQDFLHRLGASLEKPAVFTDVTGERLAIGKELFQKPDGQWKANKRERGPYMPLLARALQDPDEIWVRLEWHYALKKAVVRRRYIARFDVQEQEAPALVVFDLGDDGWFGTTAFHGRQQEPDDWRIGVRLYQRP